MAPSEVNMLVNRFAEDKAAIEEQLRKAVAALQKFAEKKEAQASAETGTLELLPEPETVTLSLSLNHIPAKKDFRFTEIVVPHPVIDLENKSICLLARDPKDRAVAQVAKEALPIEKIITIKSLKKKYAGLESKRELVNRFDLFVCEQQVYELMPKLLGKYVFQTKKAKIPIALKNLTKAGLDKAVHAARFRIRGGSNVGIRLGHRNMSVDNLVGNAMAVIEHMATVYCTSPKTQNNIFNVSIGGTNLVDLPVWSVPVRVEAPAAAEEAKPVEPVVTPATPENKKAKKVEIVEAPVDIAAVPIKKLRQVQKQRVEAAKAELETATPNNKKKQKTK